MYLKKQSFSCMIEPEGKVSSVYSFVQMGLVSQYNGECQKMNNNCNDSKC